MLFILEIIFFQLQFCVANNEKVTIFRNVKNESQSYAGRRILPLFRGWFRKWGYQVFYSKQSLFVYFSLALCGTVLGEAPGEFSNTPFNVEQF